MIGLCAKAPGNARAFVDRVIFRELCRGQLLAASRTGYAEGMRGLVARGAEGIGLACREVGLLISDAWAEVRRVGGSGRFVVYGVVNDNATSDGTLLAIVEPRLGAGRGRPESPYLALLGRPAPGALPRIASATCPSGTTSSTAPSSIASFGIPKTTLVASSWAIVRDPALFISRSPSAPSFPIPVRITPTAFGPADLATERKRTSTLGLCRVTSGPSRTSTT